MPFPVVPEYITVHLGPPDQTAENVTVPFTDYIKNVASSEIYPTWPENALRANILAQISVALNRIYTEYYRGAATISTLPALPATIRPTSRGAAPLRTSTGWWTTASTTTLCGRVTWSRCTPSSVMVSALSARVCPSGAAWTWRSRA